MSMVLAEREKGEVQNLSTVKKLKLELSYLVALPVKRHFVLFLKLSI